MIKSLNLQKALLSYDTTYRGFLCLLQDYVAQVFKAYYL